MGSSVLRVPRVRLLAAGSAVALVLFAGSAQRSPSADDIITSRLTSLLQDVARAVPQDTPGSARASAAPLDVRTMPQSVQDAVRGHMLRLSATGDVQIVVVMSAVTADRVQRLTDAGATIEIADAAPDRVQAHAPASRLVAIGSLDFVTFVRLPVYARYRIGGATTEGDALIRADAARSRFSLDGTGVRVGVISDGIKGIFATGCSNCGAAAGGPILSGDLPTAFGTRNASGVLTSSTGGITGQSFQANSDLEGLPSGQCGFLGAGAEGTALLEIVHDLAPGAKLAFANADTDLAFNKAVNFLASTNDVVVDDLGFLGLPYDGTSGVSANTANALNNNAFPIRTYATAVGNDANDHYLGNYVDSGIEGTTISGIGSAGHLHLFQSTTGTSDVLGLGARPYDVVFLPQNGEVVTFLTWDDRFGASANNYDLYLVNQTTGKVVAKSTDVQSGAQDPVEAFDYVNTSAAGYFQIVVQNVNNRAAAKQLNMYSYEPECAFDGPRPLVTGRHERHNYNTPGQSVAAQGDAGGSPVSVISAGAICSGSAKALAIFTSTPDESCVDRTLGTAEFFSSQGPTIDGRLKPDVAAIDGVSVSGAGSFDNPFFGTSAAAPHVAGEAALLLQAAPCLVGSAAGALGPVDARTALRNLIVQNTMSDPSQPPTVSLGYGLIDVLAATGKTLPAFRGNPAVTVSGNTPSGASVTGSALGFADPTGCRVTNLNWTGGCGVSPGTSMSCPFGTTTVNVSASNNGLAFSTASTVAVTVTNFSLSAAPGSATAHAGQSATYTATISAQGGPFTDAVTLGCANLPPGTTCTFTPPAIAPGAGSSQVSLTIATTGSSSSGVPVAPMIIGGIALLVLCVSRFVNPGAKAPGLHLPGRSRFVRSGPGGLGSRFVHATMCMEPWAFRPGGLIALLALSVSCSGSSTPLPVPSGSVTLTPSALTFPATTVGVSSAAQTITLTNGTTSALQITSVAATGDFAQTTTCQGSIAADTTCTIQVTFKPTASGSRTGTITVTDNGSGSPRTVALSGTGNVGATPNGTYQLSVTGTAGTLVQTTGVTLVVQ